MLFLFVMAGCAPDLTPAWAFDPIWLEPTEAEGVHGFQTWELFGPKWDSTRSDKHYVCAVVVEFDGTPAECDQAGCTDGWAVTPEILESDCDGSVQDDPLFVALTQVGMGQGRGFADYGGGWEVHGEAYPEAIDFGAASGSWDDGDPYTLMPTKAFPFPP